MITCKVGGWEAGFKGAGPSLTGPGGIQWGWGSLVAGPRGAQWGCPTPNVAQTKEYWLLTARACPVSPSGSSTWSCRSLPVAPSSGSPVVPPSSSSSSSREGLLGAGASGLSQGGCRGPPSGAACQDGGGGGRLWEVLG